MAQILEYEGYAVATAYDGREALEYLRGHPTPDLIVLDLMMPVMNGWELRAELAKVPAFAKVPIVVMTALAQAAKIEADAIVAKPIDLKRLLLIMDRLLAAARTPMGRRREYDFVNLEYWYYGSCAPEKADVQGGSPCLTLNRLSRKFGGK